MGEVSRLYCGDVDSGRNLLVIRETRFDKSRIAPFGPRIGAMLYSYLQARQRQSGTLTADTPVFSFARDRPIEPRIIIRSFHALVRRLELKIPHGTSLPRPQDLRHSFAVGAILRWYRAGIDPRLQLLQLSTLLGHAGPEIAAGYLMIAEELLQEANRRIAGPACRTIRDESSWVCQSTPM